MRRIIIAAMISGLLALNGCAAGDMLYDWFGIRNSDQADLKKISKGNKFPAIPD